MLNKINEKITYTVEYADKSTKTETVSLFVFRRRGAMLYADKNIDKKSRPITIILPLKYKGNDYIDIKWLQYSLYPCYEELNGKGVIYE